MATQFTKAKGRELVGCLAFCLRADGPRRLLEWFNLPDPDKEALLKMLKSLFGNEIEIDLAGLRKMIETFMDLTDPATVLDRDRVSWEAVANGKSKIQQLELNVTGRRIWYESLREEGDTEWKDDDKPPPVDEQYYLTKLRKVGKLTLEHLKVLEDRWKKGERMLELYKSFMKIANTTGPGQTILNLQLKEITVGKVVETIKKGNKEANEWAGEISAYFNVPIAGEFQEAMKFFFTGSGCEVEDNIDWGKLKKRLEDGDITALKMVSEEIKPANEMTEVNSTLKVLGETMLRVNNLGEEPVETEKERKENQRRKDVREGFKEKYERWYHIIVAAYITDGEAAKLKASKTQLIKYGEIVKSLAATWADIRNYDSDFVEVRKLKYHADGEEKEIDAEDGLIEMSERIRETEEELKEERKAKEDLQKQDVKRSEAMMKKENMVTYEGKASFLEWAGTITKLLEQLPESTADVIVCSFVKTTINHKETFNLIQNCKTTEEIMKIMGELHATDKSVVIEAFAPVKQLKKPTTYSIAFHNGQVILRTADTLISIGIEEAIELNELDLCVDKAIHDARYQAWLEYSHTELKKLAAADAEGHPVEKTKLEEKGKYDITHSIQSFNKGRSLARNFHLLCKWIKEDMSLVQDAKDREERTHSRGHSSQRGGGNSTGSYFVQQNPGIHNTFGGNRGGRQAPGGYRKPYGTNGGAPQGQRFPGGGQGRPNKHPDCQVALERWRSLKGVGTEAKPMTKDCPLKCSHAIPFGNAGWCATFRKYEPSMKLDVVKKNGLCRRCLSNWGPPHSPKDCRAPACSKCKGDHNTLICPAPSGSVQIHATGFVDIYKDRDVFDDLDPQIMMLTMDGGEQGILGGGEDEMGQYYVGETIIEEYTEDDIIFEDPDEPVNHFCINLIEDTLQINTIGRYSQSQGTSTDNGEREETMPEVERICSKDAMGELKSDDTKPTGQKVSGGHLMTEAADSLRTNADSGSDIKSGCKNTEGTPICKVNTIRQADQNSEPLCSEKPVQETGSKDLTGGKSECENHTEVKPRDTKEEKQVTKPTWSERVWARLEQEGTNEWNESICTKEISEGNQVEMIGNQILEDNNIEPMESPRHENEREDIIECSRSTRYPMKDEPTVPETNTVYTEYEMKEQRYPSYIENKDYHLLNKKTAKDEVEKELYTRMVKAAVKINKIFPSVRGMTDAVCVIGKSKQPNSEMLKDEKGTWVTCLFDNGAETGAHTQTLEEAVELEKLEERPMILNTVNGAMRKIYDIKKIKLATDGKHHQGGNTYTLSSAQVDHIGVEKGHMKAYVNVISFLLQMTPKLKKHFMKQCSDDQKEIQLILGQKGGSMLTHEVIPEQLGLRQHWLLPNLTIFKNSLTQNLILAGELGIDGRLVDEDYPTLYPTKQEFEKLKRKLADGEDISDELGENLMAKQFVPNEHNNSAYYYQEAESSARSSGVRTVNDLYAEKILNSEKEAQGSMREARISNTLKGIWEETTDNYRRDLTNMEDEKVRKSVAAKQKRGNIINYQGCKNIKELIDSEADISSKAKCERCRQRDCEDCDMFKEAYSVQDTDLYRHDPHEIDKPENSRLEEARRRTNLLIHKLKKEGSIESLKEQIASKIERGILKEIPEEEWSELLKGMYDFSYLNRANKENSQSPRLCLLRDMMISNKERANFSLEENAMLTITGEDYPSLISLKPHKHEYPLDISKCHPEVKMDELTSILASCYWYKDAETMQNQAIHINSNIEFGDAIATLAIRIIQVKFLMETREMDLAKEILLNSVRGDNYSSSLKTIEEYIKARDEMNRLCNNIEGPRKGNHADIGISQGILQKLAKENGESPTDTLLGLTQELRSAGAQGGKKLMDMTVTDFAEPLFPWRLTRRAISRIATQAYSRLGAMWVPVITNLKNWVSRAWETIDISITTKDAITIGTLGDEGASGLGGKAYIGSERIDKGAKETNWNLSPIKPKATEKIIPAYAMMSKPLEIRNMLSKGATNATKQGMKGTLETLPEATTQLTWKVEDKNTATELQTNPVRHGPKELLMTDGKGHASYYKIDAEREVGIPLPEKLIQTARRAEDKMENRNQARVLTNNPIEEHSNMCTICTVEAKQDIEEHKGPKKDEETESKECEEKMKEESLKLQGKKETLQTLRGDETCRRMRKRAKKRLFDPLHEYSLAEVGFKKETCELSTGMSCKASRRHAVGKHIVQFTRAVEGESIIQEEGQMELWRKMVLGSQKEKERVQLKMLTYQRKEGEKYVELRVNEDRAWDIWGIKCSAILPEDSQPGIRLIREALEKMTEGYGTTQEGVTMTLAALQTVDMCNKLQINKLSDEYIWQGDLARSGWNEVLVEKTYLDAIRKGLLEYSPVINHAESKKLRTNMTNLLKGNIKEGIGKGMILGEIGDLVLVKTSGITRKGTYGVNIEIHSEGSAAVHAKDRDMKRAIGGLRLLGTESPL